MRVNEPFAGINFVHGGLVFHIALLIASIIVIFFTEDEPDDHGFMFLINVFRAAHVVTIIYRLVEYVIDRSEGQFVSFIFTQKIAETLSMCLYFMTAVYSLWYMSKHDPFEWKYGVSESHNK